MNIREKDSKKRKFNSIMKIYTFNSFIYCANMLILGFVLITIMPEMYENESIRYSLTADYKFMTYFVYFYINFTVFPYTFGIIMDIYIAYSRIQIFKKKLKFLQATSVKLNTLNFNYFLINLIISRIF